MKLRNKLLTVFAPVAAISSLAAPIAMVSCSKATDIYIQSKQSKTLELTPSVGEYVTDEDSVIFLLKENLMKPESESTKYKLRYEYKNLKYSKCSKEPSLGVKDEPWSISEGKISSIITNFTVADCTLESGAEITFDLLVQFGGYDATTKAFTPISNKVEFKGWKLTYTVK